VGQPPSISPLAIEASRIHPVSHLYRPAWWLPGPHLQTLWGRFFRTVRTPQLTQDRMETPDGDFLDVYRIRGRSDRPRLLLLHGLEGGLRSHYARGILAAAAARGWSASLMVFRSCGPELNRQPRFYHSGDTEDVRLVLARLIAEDSDSPIVLAGVSLGGNVLLRLLAEEGEGGREIIAGAAAISVPFDLARSARYINRGFSRLYERHFVRSLKRKALAKRARHSALPAAQKIQRVRTLYEFDDLVTAPLHGFADAEDDYARANSLAILERISVPTLLLSAADDPFLPAEVLEQVRRAAQGNSALELAFVSRGGHVGFVTGRPWRQAYWAETRALDFLEQRAREWMRAHAAANIVAKGAA
jgi:predicted alpha/beta-fold hydrolase